ncbi:MAG: hypothetical protein JRN25_04465 [Nitrososphaerota archaeon]|nr:hypothetical protein [Nitrososphaerota archaeon]MDG6961530.1 hypothetical protein [Nitrososphaerota archaeon]
MNQTLSSIAATSSPPETAANGSDEETEERSLCVGRALAFRKNVGP